VVSASAIQRDRSFCTHEKLLSPTCLPDERSRSRREPARQLLRMATLCPKERTGEDTANEKRSANDA
jgi:hypothetical protein